jgi:hypothetical protein
VNNFQGRLRSDFSDAKLLENSLARLQHNKKESSGFPVSDELSRSGGFVIG